MRLLSSVYRDCREDNIYDDRLFIIFLRWEIVVYLAHVSIGKLMSNLTA